MNSKMIEELKPCPFCGGEAQVTSYNSCDCCGKAWNGSVSCEVCAASRDHFDTDAEAITAWNTRTAYDPDKRLREALAKCRDKFREYEGLHTQKLRDYKGKEPLNYAAHLQFKINRNREMAEMCDAALSHNGG